MRLLGTAAAPLGCSHPSCSCCSGRAPVPGGGGRLRNNLRLGCAPRARPHPERRFRQSNAIFNILPRPPAPRPGTGSGQRVPSSEVSARIWCKSQLLPSRSVLRARGVCERSGGGVPACSRASAAPPRAARRRPHALLAHGLRGREAVSAAAPPLPGPPRQPRASVHSRVKTLLRAPRRLAKVDGEHEARGVEPREQRERQRRRNRADGPQEGFRPVQKREG